MAIRGSGFLCKGTSMREVTWIHYYPMNSVKKQPHLPKLYSVRCKAVLASNSFRSSYLKLQNKQPPSSRAIARLQSLKPCGVKSDETRDPSSGESILLDEDTLRQDLQIAIEEENYAEAAKIRDTLKALHEDRKASVLSTNARFYESFRNGDLAAMQSLWAKSENACCVHPGAKGITGYDYVMESWEVVWMNYDFPLDIKVKEVEVHVRGDVGYVTCMEFVKTKGSRSWGAQFVTNVFERIDGQWFICIHHASPVDI